MDDVLTGQVTRPEPAEVTVAGRPADYADVFRIDGLSPTPRPRSAAETMLAGSQLLGGLFAKTIWRAAIGLDVHPGRGGTVAGWQVASDTDTLLDVVTGDGRTHGRMTFEADGTSLTWTTALRFEHGAGPLVWRLLGPVHRALVPRLLTRLAAG